MSNNKSNISLETTRVLKTWLRAGPFLAFSRSPAHPLFSRVQGLRGAGPGVSRPSVNRQRVFSEGNMADRGSPSKKRRQDTPVIASVAPASISPKPLGICFDAKVTGFQKPLKFAPAAPEDVRDQYLSLEFQGMPVEAIRL